MKYTPHPYQEYCIDYLLSHPAAGLFLKPGMGKTSVALTAADRLLYDTFEATRALVIAPLRVAEGKRKVGPPTASPGEPGAGRRERAAGGAAGGCGYLLHQPGERGLVGKAVRHGLAV